MRSLLFIPADSPQKLAKGLGSGADALLLDLEDSISLERKEAARDGALEFLAAHRDKTERPKLIVRINSFASGFADDDLNAIVPGRPDAVMFPKAEGGASVIHLDAKLTAREAVHGLTEGAIKVVAIATETAKALFLAGTYRGSLVLFAVLFPGTLLAQVSLCQPYQPVSHRRCRRFTRIWSEFTKRLVKGRAYHAPGLLIVSRAEPVMYIPVHARHVPLDQSLKGRTVTITNTLG